MANYSKQIKAEITDNLLTIGIYTYNSEKYILESLNSIQSKFEEKIQLILSDDASSDDTVSVIKSWITQNKERFLDVILITSEENKGFVGNLNYSLNFIRGTWFKPMGGDDLFPENSIDKMIGEIMKNPSSNIILGLCKLFGDTPHIGKTILNQSSINYLKKNSKIENQIEWLLGGHYFPAPGFIFKTALVNKLNGFDKEFPDFEDVPFQLKFLFAGYKITISEELFLNYRKHNEGLSNFNRYVIHPKFLVIQKLLLKYAIKHGKTKFTLNLRWNIFFTRLIFYFGNRNKLCVFFELTRRKLQPKKFFSLLSQDH
jgi:glycosyltransferase involved in cell wall biosynthesis